MLATRLPASGPPDSLPLCLPERVTALLGVGTVAQRDVALVREAVAELDSEEPELRAALDLAQLQGIAGREGFVFAAGADFAEVLSGAA